MKALVRREGETIHENSDLKFIDWKTGSPLTDSEWCGGPYTLVDNYVETTDGAVYDVPEASQDPVTDTIVVDGVTYTRKS